MSLFDCKTKLFSFNEKQYSRLISIFGNDHEEIEIYNVKMNEEFRAYDRSGSAHRFNAPASGVVLFVSGRKSDREAINSLLSIWEQAKLTPPEVIPAERISDAELRTRAIETIIKALHVELRQTASDAVRLDRQIAALREELENTRMRLCEVNAQDRLAGGLPVMSFDRQSNGAVWDMGSAPVGRQLLPYAGNLLRGLAIQVEDLSFLESGELIASLRAQEDDSILASWHVDETAHDGWIVLAIEEPISYKYRYVDLELQWYGDHHNAPQVRLGDAFGDPEASLVTDDGPGLHNMLALRVWSGGDFDKEAQSSFINFPHEVDASTMRRFAVRVPEHRLQSMQPVVKREFQWNWYSCESNNLFLHPTLGGSSIVRIDLKTSMQTTSLSTLACNANRNAPSIDFSIIIASDDLSEDELEQIAYGDAGTDAVVGRAGWTTVMPGTSVPIAVPMQSVDGMLYAYFLTRVTGDNVSYAHFWFRNLKMELR